MSSKNLYNAFPLSRKTTPNKNLQARLSSLKISTDNLCGPSEKREYTRERRIGHKDLNEELSKKDLSLFENKLKSHQNL